MALVEKSVLVLHSAQQMFDLVDGVELYPQFLPWCGGTDVKWRDEASTVATVMIDFHRIKQSFTTENTKQIPSLIEMKLQDGPFRHLDGSWRFIALNENACKVEFRLHYEFSSKLLESLVGPVFNHITSNFVDAFVERAEKVYGTS
ncbi:MAG: type II toxin-antitoxin system RatA family toxin [Pseudomonadota bacterium]|jgi:ribosome-associated toxin RatA of RatAB toxin-antitoxin module|nr:type II toxin-antitoxin system RatA family toxin [Gammaproteobacteria bacterium]MBU1731582.1 type II toxin-antitoxin system RatA family toxin [Gammaproteobacteria bacterium]MBU1893742.1 type II toxin-antitoxin system RatA family toxin [Gammaproteobacteria bacterium]